MRKKILEKTVSSILSFVICVSSFVISPLTVGAKETDTVTSNATANQIEVQSEQNENITLKWLYEDTKYHHGSSFDIDETSDISNSIGINVAYDIQKVRDEGYKKGELSVTVKGIGDIYRKNTLQATSVGADKITDTTKTHDWSYSYDGSEDIYTFTNNKEIDGSSVLNGYFDIIWSFSESETINGYSQDNIQAVMTISETDTVSSNTLTLTNKTYRDIYRGDFTANRLASSTGMKVTDPSEYIFIRYNLEHKQTAQSRHLQSPEWDTYTLDIDADSVGSGAVICNTEKSLAVLSKNGNICKLDKSKSTGNIYVAYPKSEYMGKTIRVEYKAVGTYEDEEEQTILFCVNKSLLMDDFLKFDKSGSFYLYDKSIIGGTSYDKIKNAVYGRTLEKSNTLSYNLSNGMSVLDRVPLDTDLKMPDTTILTGGTSPFILMNNTSTESNNSEYKTGKFIGYTFDLYDDMQYARKINGEYRKLNKEDYHIVSVTIPSVQDIDAQNDTIIQSDKYPVKIYAGTNGKQATKTENMLIYSGHLNQIAHTVELPEHTTDILISTENLKEVCNIAFAVNISYHIQNNDENDSEAIDLVSGELVNCSALKIYAEFLNYDTHKVENIWVDAQSDKIISLYSGKDIDEEFTAVNNVYPDREITKMNVYGNAYKDNYTSVTKLSTITSVQNHFESEMTIGGNFNFVDEDKPNQFSLYTILPKGISIKDCRKKEQLWDLMQLSGMGMNNETLAEYCTAQLITNYRNSSQTYLALHFDFNGRNLSPDRTDNITNISTYSINAKLPLSITTDTLRKNPSVIVRSATEFINTENYKMEKMSISDNGKWSSDTQLFSDIDNNGKTDDTLAVSYDYQNFTTADYSQLQLQKSVKSQYTGDYVSTEENPVVSYGSDYSYKLEIINGSRDLTNVIIRDILENEPNSKWKGTLQSVECDTDLKGTVYYSTKINPDDNLSSKDWTTEKADTVKAVAVDFGKGILKSGKRIDIILNMTAENDSTFKNTFTENKCSLSVTTAEDESNKFELTSNATKLKLVPALYDIILTKEDSKTSDKLSNAEFTLYDENNNAVSSVKTNAKGYAVFSNISSDQTYTLKETKAPFGYLKANDETIVLNGDYPVTIKDERKKGTIELHKFNSLAGDIPVSGAEYSILSNNKVIRKVLTDENGIAVFDELEWGTYTIKETNAPLGYKADTEEHIVEINRNNVEEPLTIFVSDKQTENIVVTLTKYESLTDGTQTQTVLPNSTFKLFRVKDNEKISVGKFKTNSNGKITISDIPYGDYILTETVVPVGYKKCDDISFTVFREKSNYSFVAYDNRKSGIIELTNTANGNVVKGAKFNLYNAVTNEIIATSTTDEDGYLNFDNLEWGNYYIRQISVPDYLVLNTRTLSAEIKADNLKESLEIDNNGKLGEVLITKTDEIGKQKLSGAKFSLYKKDGSLIRENLITNSEGQLYIKDLAWGNYYLKEIQAPVGYDVTESNIHFMINEDTVSTVQELVVSDPLSTDKNSATVTITAKIKADDVNFANGNPTFLFKLHTDSDIYNRPHTYYRMVTFDENYVKANTDTNGYVEQNVTFSGLPSGKYTATEEESSRYRVNSIQNGIQSVVKDNYAEFDLINNKIGSVTFINSKYEWGDYSDTQRVANILKKSKSYTALKTIWNGDDNAVYGEKVNTDNLTVKAIYDDGSTKIIDKADYTLDTDTIKIRSGRYPVTVSYKENGINHTSIFYINVQRKVIDVARLKVNASGSLSDDNVVGQGDVISPLEFDVSVTQSNGKEVQLSAGELVADETQSVTVTSNNGQICEKTFEGADAVKVSVSGYYYQIYGRGNVKYSLSSSEVYVLGDYVKISSGTATLIPCYLQDGDYSIDVHQAPNKSDETVKVIVSLNSEWFKSDDNKNITKSITLTTDNDRTETYAVGKELPHFVLGVIYDNDEDTTMTVRGNGDVDNYSIYNYNGTSYINSRNISWSGTAYKNKIVSVEIKQSVKPVSMAYWFSNFTALENPPVIPNGVKDISSICNYCSSLKQLPEIPSSVTELSYAFQNSSYSQSALPKDISLDLSQNTIHNADSLFYGQSSIENLNIIFSNIDSINNIASECKNLKTATIIADDVGSAGYMFSNCYSIKNVSFKCHNAQRIYDGIAYSGKYDNQNGGTMDKFEIIATGEVNYLQNTVGSYYGVIKNINIDIDTLNYADSILYNSYNYTADNCTADIHIEKYAGDSIGSSLFSGNNYISRLNIGIDELISDKDSIFYIYGMAQNNPCLKAFTLSMPKLSITKGLSLSYLCADCPNLKGVTLNIDNSKPLYMSYTFSGDSSLLGIPELPDNILSADGMFRQCTSLKNVELNLPNAANTTYIFDGCTSLENAEFSANQSLQSDNAFHNCTGLKDVNVSLNSANSITHLFDNCVSLTDVSLKAEKVEDISYLFSDCNALRSVSALPQSTVNMSYCFKNCIALHDVPDLPPNADDISYAFSGCDTLTNITLHNATATKTDGLFHNCNGLLYAEVTLDNALTVNQLFNDCKNLKKATVSVMKATDISGMFKNCSCLTDVSVRSDNATNMANCFYNCTSLSEFPSVPPNIENMEYTFYNCKKLTVSPSLPDTVKILTGTYMNCESLTEIPDIHNAVVNMSRTFMGDTSLTTADIQQNTAEDISYIFMNCSHLERAVVNTENAKNVSHAFDGCINLTELTFSADNAENLAYCFSNCKKITTADFTFDKATDISYLFNGNSSLKSLKLTADNATIVDNLVNDCTELETVILSINSANDVTALFKNRKKLTTATVKANKSEKANELFANCSALNDVDVEIKNAVYVNNMFENNTSLTGEHLSVDMENAKYAYYLFNRCSKLKQAISLPDSIEYLGNAFYGCVSLENTVTLPKNLTYMAFAFYNCYKMSGSIALPKNIQYMGYAFYQCQSLSSVSGDLPEVISMVGAFEGCTSLTTANLTTMNKVEYMGGTFKNCYCLESIPNIPESVKELYQTFTNCQSITTATICSDNVSRAEGLFNGCRKLQTANITLNNISSADNLFMNCSELETLTLSVDKATSFQATFSGCAKLKNIPNIDFSKATNLQSTFYGCGIEEFHLENSYVENLSSTFSSCKSLKTVTLNTPNVKKMDYTFSLCTSLENAPVLPESVQNLSGAFAGCESLIKAPNLPYGVTDLRTTFRACKSLRQAPVIPATVQSLEWTFEKCAELTGNLIVNANPKNYYRCLYDTSTSDSAELVLSGQSTMLDKLLMSKSDNSHISIKAE